MANEPINYKWIVHQMVCAPQVEGQTDVVLEVHWRKNATSGQISATTYGSVSLSYHPDNPFTPYADLTKEQVVAWVEEALGAERCEEIDIGLESQIAAQVNPKEVVLPLPWAG